MIGIAVQNQWTADLITRTESDRQIMRSPVLSLEIFLFLYKKWIEQSFCCTEPVNISSSNSTGFERNMSRGFGVGGGMHSWEIL